MSRKTRRRQRNKSSATLEESLKRQEPILERSIDLPTAQSDIGYRGLNRNINANGVVFANNDAETLTNSRLIKNVPIINRAIREFQNSCALSKWSVIPVETGNEQTQEEANMYADLTREFIIDNPNFNFTDVVRRDAGFKFHGFAVSEWKMYQREEDGLYSYIDIAARSQGTITQFRQDPRSGYVEAFIQRGTRSEHEIPRWKSIYHVDNSIDDNPKGQGVLKPIQGTAKRWLNLVKIELQSMRQDLRGLLIGEAPYEELQEKLNNPNLTDEQKRVIMNNAENLRTIIDQQDKVDNIGLLTDSSVFFASNEIDKRPSSSKKYDLRLLQGDSKGLVDLANAIKRLEHEMARAMGVENILLGDTQSGSRALSEDKSKAFHLQVEQTLESMRREYQNSLVLFIFIANEWPIELMPVLEVERISFRDIGEEIDAYVKMRTELPPESPAMDQFASKLGYKIESLEDRVAAAERLRQEMQANIGNNENGDNDN